VTDALEDIHQNINGLSITGGGAQSELWSQMVSDVLNKPLQHCKGDSSLGAAILAAHGAGLFPTLQAAQSALMPATRTIHPRPDAAAIYTRLYGEYRTRRAAFLGSL
jgi:xylulokinase